MGALLSWIARDRRRAERLPCFDLAVAELSVGEARCLVLNRSDVGLLLEFRGTPRLDPTFSLRDFAVGQIVDVALVWQRADRAGVTLVRDEKHL